MSKHYLYADAEDALRIKGHSPEARKWAGNFLKVAAERDRLLLALTDLVQAHRVGMGKSAVELRVELAEGALER